MLNSLALLFVAGFSGGIAYLIGLNHGSHDNKQTFLAATTLAEYTTELEEENANLRTACEESSYWGPMMNPSFTRRSHLTVVK